MLSSVLFAVQWPPPAANIPPVVPNMSSVMDVVWDSLSGTLKSIGSTGFLMFAVVLAVSFIPFLFRILFLDHIKFENSLERRKLNRKIDGVDMDRNADDIIENQLRHRMLSREVSLLDVGRNSEDIIDEQLSNRSLNRKIKKREFDCYFDDLVDDRVRGTEVNYAAREQFMETHEGENNYAIANQAYYKKRRGGGGK